MKETQWILSDKLKQYPAMNEYSPTYQDVTFGIITYIVVWIIVLIVLFTVMKDKVRHLPIVVGFICGAIFIYLEYIMKYSKYSFFLLPDKKMYSTRNALGHGNDYQVMFGNDPYGDIDVTQFGYLVTNESFEKYDKQNKKKFTTLKEYLSKLQKPVSGKVYRENGIPTIDDGYGIEMTGLSRTAYYISIIMITWIGFIYINGSIDIETNIFSLLAVLFSIVSTIPLFIPTKVDTMSKHVFFRQTTIHVATAFAISALTERLIQK